VRRRIHFARWMQVLLMGLALLVALTPARTFAADIRQGDVVTVGPTQTINDDVYAFGGTVDVQGRVNGDVVAAGGTVTIHGTVTGDLLAAGGTTTVAGTVGGTVRAAGGTTTIDGPVGKDVLVTGGTVRLEPSARVGRDLLTGAGSVILAGQVARNVQAGSGTLRLDKDAVVGGNLTYSSDQTAQIAPGARVQGTIAQHAPQDLASGRLAAYLALKLTGSLAGCARSWGWVCSASCLSWSRPATVAARRTPWAARPG
jgi:cytoskeletal protein CcmA (bactofilin family)